jgi:hypothetical protein
MSSALRLFLWPACGYPKQKLDYLLSHINAPHGYPALPYYRLVPICNHSATQVVSTTQNLNDGQKYSDTFFRRSKEKYKGQSDKIQNNLGRRSSAQLD